MVEFHRPKPTRLPKQWVENLANYVAEKLEFSAGDNIEDVVKKLGGRIHIGSTGDEDQESGSLIAHSISDFDIYLSPITSLERDRFTIAHELGHLILHLPSIMDVRKEDVAMRATRYMKDEDEPHRRAEWEANWFAAAFLMPEDEFRANVLQKGIEKTRLHFRVSIAAVKARAQSLQLNIG